MTANENFLDNYELNGKQLRIFTYPSPVLSKVAEEVTKFDDELRDLCKDMLFTMYKAPGIGLAAPQIGLSKRLFVVDIDFDREEVTNADGSVDTEYSNFNPKVFINPKITTHDGLVKYEEGCLSVPGIFEEVERASSITIEYNDMWGNTHTEELDGLQAICLQHENDHLNGIVFLDRLGTLKKNLLKKKILKQKKFEKRG